MPNLLSVAEARIRLLAAFARLENEMVPLLEASDRVLAEDVVSGLDLPLFANSSMDGFAVKAMDVHSASPNDPVDLVVVEDVPAGSIASKEIERGQAARIMTGAAIPPGSDAVVPIEDTDQYYPGSQPQTPLPGKIKVVTAVKAGDYVRPQGQDVREGETVLRRGIRLRPQDIGFMAMLGIAKVRVYRKPRTALVSTGDELIQLEESLRPGKIYDSNAYTLSALVKRVGGEPIYLGIARDNEQAVRSVLDEAIAREADLILSTAGVSVGAFDFVREVVEKYGELDFWRIDMRPGKPLAFGNYRMIPFVGLPGNPVSAFVGFEVFVRLALFKMLGLEDHRRPTLQVELLEPVISDGRESYLRAIISSRGGRWYARLTGHQGSGNLRSLVQANALLIIPPGVKSLPAGSEAEAWLLDEVEEGLFEEIRA